MRSYFVSCFFIGVEALDGYEQFPGTECRGNQLHTYSDGTASGYGDAFPKTVKDCAAICNGHEDCVAFHEHVGDKKCSFWFESFIETRTQPDFNCYKKKPEGNYEVRAGKACSGTSIEFFFKKDDCKTDGDPSHYGHNLHSPSVLPIQGDREYNVAAFQKFKREEEARCAKICNEKPDCRGFSSFESPDDVNAAFPGFKNEYKCSMWKNGDLSKGSAVTGFSCHMKKSKDTAKCNADGSSPSGGVATTTRTTTATGDTDVYKLGNEVEIQLQIPKRCPQQIRKEEVRTRNINVPVHVPETIAQDVPFPVPTPVQVPVPVTQTVHVRVPVPNVIERSIPTPVTVQVQVPVPVPTPVQNPIPVPVPQTIQQRVPVPVFVDRVVDVPVPVPVPMQMPHPTAQLMAPSPYVEPVQAYSYGQPTIAGLSDFNGVGIAGPPMPAF